jgi:hypothetical protein
MTEDAQTEPSNGPTDRRAMRRGKVCVRGDITKYKRREQKKERENINKITTRKE